MGRVITGTLVGGIVAFIWGMTIWMYTPLFNNALNELPKEKRVMSFMQKAGLETGAYVFPAWPEDMKDEEAVAEHEEKYSKGPLGFLVYSAEGKTPMDPKVFAKGFGLNLLAAFVLSIILYKNAKPCFKCRFLTVFMIGIFAAIVGPGMNWNWMHYPNDFTIASIIDYLGASAVLGLVLAAIVKPTKQVEA